MDINNELACCLKDCGFSSEEAGNYLEAVYTEDIYRQIKILEKQRKQMLEEMHSAAKKIDCIDFMIRKCKDKIH